MTRREPSADHPNEAEATDRVERSAESLFADYLSRRENGEEVDFNRWVSGHREFEKELRKLERGMSSFEREVARVLIEDVASVGNGYFHRYVGREDDGGGERTLHVRSGDRIGGFELIRQLGRGGMGTVWEARQSSLARNVALKLLHPGTRLDGRRRARLAREAQAAARLSHPNIVSVHGFEEEDGQAFIVQELITGNCTLANFIKDTAERDDRPKDYFQRVATFLLKVADALACAHESAVIHRDVKPQNILITESDEPMVADFGLARLEDAEPLTETGELAGTYCYMSPEQAIAGRVDLDHRTDVFSLGTTMYELLTLKRAFDAETTRQVTEKIVTFDPPEAKRIDTHVPGELSAICAIAMEKYRRDRYQSMNEMAEDLRRWLAREPILGRPPGRVRRMQKWIQRHPAVTTVCGVVLLAVITVGYFAGETSAAEHERKVAQRDSHISRALFLIETSDMGAVLVEVDKALALLPNDPIGHLVLARGFARSAQLTEAREQIQIAVSKGLSTDESQVDTAEEHWSYGYYLMLTELKPSFDRVEYHLVKAMELDPALYSMNFPLYQVRIETGNEQGALDAIRTYRSYLGEVEEFHPVVDAICHELEGDHSGAIALLDKAVEERSLDADDLVRLRMNRIYGRNYLRLYALEPLRDHLRSAERYLVGAAAGPPDPFAIRNLGEVYLQLGLSTKNDAAALDHLKRADDCARDAREMNPHIPESGVLLARSAYDRMRRKTTSDIRSTDEWSSFVERMGDLRATDPGSEFIPILERYAAAKLTEEGFDRIEAEDFEGAADSLGAAFELDVGQVPAGVMYGQMLVELERFEEALPVFEQAVVLLDEISGPNPRPRLVGLDFGGELEMWRVTALVFVLESADGLDDLASAEEALESLEEMLDEGTKLDPVSAFNFSRFLAATILLDLKDCPRARAIVEDYELASAASGDPEAAAILAEIASACP